MKEKKFYVEAISIYSSKTTKYVMTVYGFISRLPNIFWNGQEYYWYSNIWYKDIPNIRQVYTDGILGRPWIPEKIPDKYSYNDIAIKAYKEVFNKCYVSLYLPLGKSAAYYLRIHEYNERIRK